MTTLAHQVRHDFGTCECGGKLTLDNYLIDEGLASERSEKQLFCESCEEIEPYVPDPKCYCRDHCIC